MPNCLSEGLTLWTRCCSILATEAQTHARIDSSSSSMSRRRRIWTGGGGYGLESICRANEVIEISQLANWLENKAQGLRSWIVSKAVCLPDYRKHRKTSRTNGNGIRNPERSLPSAHTETSPETNIGPQVLSRRVPELIKIWSGWKGIRELGGYLSLAPNIRYPVLLVDSYLPFALHHHRTVFRNALANMDRKECTGVIITSSAAQKYFSRIPESMDILRHFRFQKREAYAGDRTRSSASFWTTTKVKSRLILNNSIIGEKS
ncbi:predicted protein [Histoplasma capsulatum H143]|uniref:Uncharacterized protein n=1 Tax=Ajellomyces capsulatus (strain H143) TaxID=544712 RepID=C6HHY0_AJECH|nr:predicted protein [Histoplasma capsulatum H143]